jgi:hypothetical protein
VNLEHFLADRYSNYFGPTIYKNLGFGGNTTLMINGVSGAWQVVVVWVFIQFIGT